MSTRSLLCDLKNSIVNIDIDGSKRRARNALEEGIAANAIITEGIRPAMDVVGKKFEASEYFLSELIVAGEICKEITDMLRPHLNGSEIRKLGKVVIGTVVGDLHDIGKNIVGMMLEATGFEVYDLGVDVTPEKFAEKAMETGSRIIGVSALLSISIANVPEVIRALKKAGIREQVKVIVGGAAARPWMMDEYGVDAAVNDASKGITIIKRWATEL